MADWSRTTALALLLAAGLSLPTSPAATTTQKADEIKPAQADGVFASTINTMDIFTLENDFIEKLNVCPRQYPISTKSPAYHPVG